MLFNNKLNELQRIKDELDLKNTRTEEKFGMFGDDNRKKIVSFCKICWGIENMAEKCVDKKKTDKRPLEAMSLTEKLEAIDVIVF
jgi:hypothetical protein